MQIYLGHLYKLFQILRNVTASLSCMEILLLVFQETSILIYTEAGLIHSLTISIFMIFESASLQVFAVNLF